MTGFRGSVSEPFRKGITARFADTNENRSTTPLSCSSVGYRRGSRNHSTEGCREPSKAVMKTYRWNGAGSLSPKGGFPCWNPSDIVPSLMPETALEATGNSPVRYRYRTAKGYLVSLQIPFPNPSSGSSVGPPLPSSPMPKFLTVKEAAKATGKSPSSIRRIVYPILENDEHPDRSQIEPDVKLAKALRLKGENFAWKISEKLLRREVPEGSTKSSTDAKTAESPPNDGSAALIEMLRGELEIKNQQIATQNELMKGLSERLREGNIMIGALQQQLRLTDGSTRSKSGIVDATPEPEQGSEETEKSPPPPKPKRSFFGSLFS